MKVCRLEIVGWPEQRCNRPTGHDGGHRIEPKRKDHCKDCGTPVEEILYPFVGAGWNAGKCKCDRQTEDEVIAERAAIRAAEREEK